MHSFQFHPAVARWFEQTFGSPTDPQVRGWPAIQSARHVLISAPTGSGKTLAAFLASLDALFREGVEADLPDETQLLYVSPLKALSNDIRKNLQEPLAGIRSLLNETNGREIDVRAGFAQAIRPPRNGRRLSRSRRTFSSRRRNPSICCSLPI